MKPGSWPLTRITTKLPSQSVPKPQPSQHVEDSAVWNLGSMVPWCLDPPSGALVPIFPPDPFLKWFCKQPSPSVPHLLKSRGVPLSQNQKYPPNSPCFFLSSQATWPFVRTSSQLVLLGLRLLAHLCLPILCSCFLSRLLPATQQPQKPEPTFPFPIHLLSRE